MQPKTLTKEELLALLEELIATQQNKLYQFGREMIPRFTFDDLLQPNDFPELENNPLFRYEEGILEGLMTVRAALLNIYSEAD